jgi:hypothetical protein
MPLKPSTSAQVISDMGTFSFPMMDGAIVVPVQVTDDTLEYMASRDHTHLNVPAERLKLRRAPSTTRATNQGRQ